MAYTPNTIVDISMTFINSKSNVYYFEKPFKQKPRVFLDIRNSNTAPAYTEDITKDYIRISFAVKFTGIVDVYLIPRI
jgi:hypothetical protein